MATAPDEVTVYAAFVTTPDGMPALAVIPCHCGGEAEAEAALKPLRTFGPPLMDAVQRMPFPAMQRLLDDAFPDGAHNYWKSTFVKELSDEVIDLLVEHANKACSPMSAVVVELYSGAADRVGRAETAFAQRQAGYDIGLMAQWTDASESETHIAWTRAMAAALEPHSSGRRLPNFVGEEDAATMRTVFGENYPRLAEIKKKYDPTNFFRVNQNIRAGGVTGGRDRASLRRMPFFCRLLGARPRTSGAGSFRCRLLRDGEHCPHAGLVVAGDIADQEVLAGLQA